MTRREEAHALAAKGHPKPEIASIMGISRQAVHIYLKQEPTEKKQPGRKPLPNVCRYCGVPITDSNKTVHHRRLCKACENIRVMEHKLKSLSVEELRSSMLRYGRIASLFRAELTKREELP